MDGNFFAQAIIYLASALICVPIAKRIGLSSILGYLFAGIIIGPSLLGLIGQKGSDIMHFAEFGVVMMLFVIGLELEPEKFWRMRKFILGMGSLQLLGSSFFLVIIGFYFVGWNFEESIVIAFALSLSSTAIVLQTLKEKGLSQTNLGRSSFSVLLFQDIAVIPILAIIPLLVASDQPIAIQNNYDLTILLPGWLKAIVVVIAILSILFLGKYVIIPVLRLIAKTRQQELFTASALLLVFAVSYFMLLVGLSPALGAFMAGVVLANSEFRHELEGDIAPFKGLLLGLFFIGVGASIDFDIIINSPIFIFSFVIALTLIKFLVLFGVGILYKKQQDQNMLFSFILSQAGEFGFVILSFSNQLKITDTLLTNQVMVVIAISMLLTPFLLLINEKYIDPYFGVKTIEDAKSDTIDEQHEVIIAGFGHFGSTIGRLLKANGVQATILDHDSVRVELLRKLGFKVYYGDATRLELLEAAGCEKAKLFISAIDNPSVNLHVVETVRKHFPQLKVMTRARNRVDAYEFIDHGVEQIYRETLYTAVHMGVDCLTELGFRKYTAHRQGQRFIKYDEDAVKKLAKKRHDKMAYLVTVQEEIEMQEQILRNDLFVNFQENDHSWTREEEL